MRAVAAELGASPPVVSLAWLLARTGITAPIVGANTVQQLQESLAALDLRLGPEHVAMLDEAAAL